MGRGRRSATPSGSCCATSSGRIYPYSTFRRWLGQAGFEDPRRNDLPGPFPFTLITGDPTMKPLPLTEQLEECLVGGKAASLAVATRAGLPVPAGVALAFGFVDAVAAGDAEARQQLAAIFRELGAPLVARSSAVGEDSEQATFAGQYVTRLNLRSEPELVDAVLAIWDSARSPSAFAYRERLRLPREPRMGVVVQELIDADTAGVLFSCNPMTGSDELVIEAAWGLGESVVAGLVTPDRFRLRRDGAIFERITGLKDIAVRIDPEGGTRQSEVPDPLAHMLCLDDRQLAALRALTLRCDEIFAGSHDLEWAFAGGRLHLLQRRTLTTIPNPAFAAADRPAP
jgi:pyruvate,water dikinase